MKIGNTLRELRLQKGLSQDQVALVLMISRQAYSRYENNERELSLDALCKLADFFGKTTDYILGRK